MISTPLAEALQARRPDFNARFRLAAQRYPQLDGQELLRFIADAVDPLARAVHAIHPRRSAMLSASRTTARCSWLGSDCSLDAGRYGVIPCDVARRVAVGGNAVIATQPARVVTSLTNAAHQLAAANLPM